MMKSFVNNYQLHILACKEPGTVGADFMDASEDQLEDIKRLIDFTDNECKDMVELAAAVKELDELLRGHTSGESIEYLYEKIPTPLKGFVELFFDMEHNPSYRLIEGLLYQSDYYKPHLQSVSFGIVSADYKRPFVFSTPRLADERHIQMNLEFDSPLLDKILKARELPLSADDIEQLKSQIQCTGGLTFDELFTTDVPSRTHEPVTEGLRLQYTGHAGFLVESKDITILMDPVIASLDDTHGDEVFSFSQLPAKIDYICLTHSHQDHVNIETLLQLRYKTDQVLVPKNNGGSIADPSLKLMLKKLGFNVIETEDMEEVAIPEGRILSLPFLGEHGDLNIRSKAAWFVELQGKKFFLGADSSNLDPNMYKHIHKFVGDIDLLLIGMECVGAPYTWMYGALHTKKVSKKVKDSRRLNGCDASLAFGMAEIFKPKEVYVYALGLEPWYNYMMGLEYEEDSVQIVESNKMLVSCKTVNLHCEKLFGTKLIEYS
jgi:L-ascorbate metabolism protein UlaG (beta-lactamase superfamily)